MVIVVHPQLLCFWSILLKGHWKAPPELQGNWTDPKPSCQMLRTLCARQLALQLRLSLLMSWLVWRLKGQCWSSSWKQLQNRSRMRPACSRDDERRSRSNMQRWNCIFPSVYEWLGLKAFHMRMSFFPCVRWGNGAGWWKRPVLWPSRICLGFWAAKMPLLTEQRQFGVKDSPKGCLFLTKSCSRLGCIVELSGNRCVQVHQMLWVFLLEKRSQQLTSICIAWPGSRPRICQAYLFGCWSLWSDLHTCT